MSFMVRNALALSLLLRIQQFSKMRSRYFQKNIQGIFNASVCPINLTFVPACEIDINEFSMCVHETLTFKRQTAPLFRIPYAPPKQDLLTRSVGLSGAQSPALSGGLRYRLLTPPSDGGAKTPSQRPFVSEPPDFFAMVRQVERREKSAFWRRTE
jgi:hypothetical protein